MRQLVDQLKTHMKIIDKDVMHMQMIDVDRIVNIPIKKHVIKDYNDGAMVFYITDETLIMPSTIPISILKNPNNALKYNSLINITNHSKIKRDQFGGINEVIIEDKKLFVFLATAWFYRKWFMDDSAFYMNSALMRCAANIYAKMAYKVLDKKWSIGVEFSRIDKVLFIFAYFFTEYMAGNHARSIDIASSIDGLSSPSQGAKVALEVTAKIKNPKNAFTSFEDCIALLNICLTDITPIDTRTFIGAYAQHWQGSTVPGIDYLPYFAQTVFSAYIGGGLSKDIAVAQLMRNDGDTFIKLLSDLYKS
jgi:hypothetical protein